MTVDIWEQPNYFSCAARSAARLFLFFFFSFLLFFFFSFFPCSADHERDWPPCKEVFRIGNQCAECEKQQKQLDERFERN